MQSVELRPRADHGRDALGAQGLGDARRFTVEQVVVDHGETNALR